MTDYIERIPKSSLPNVSDGQVVHANEYNRDNEVLRQGVNENFNDIQKITEGGQTAVVLAPDGTVKYLRMNEDGSLEVSIDKIHWNLANREVGHIIEDSEGNLMPQRNRMKFNNVVFDSPETNTTVVNAIRGVTISDTEPEDKHSLWFDTSVEEQGGIGIPTGGTTGQALRKTTDDPYNADWADIIDDTGESADTTWSSQKIKEKLSNDANLVVTTTANPLDPTRFICDYSSEEIRSALIKNKTVVMYFEDTVEGSGNQVYPFLKMTTDGAFFRRCQATEDFVRQIDIKVDYAKNVTFTDTRYTSSPEVIQARTGYFGETFDNLDDRIDNDINKVLDKVDTMNYTGTSISANNTYARNLNVNGNKFEIYGKTKKNLFDIDLEHIAISDTYKYVISGKPNTKYTCSTNAPVNSPANLYFMGESTATNGVSINSPKTFETDTAGNLTLFVRFDIRQGGINLYQGVLDGTYWIQLEEGTEATEYTPYGLYTDPKVEVVETNKNLFDTNLSKFTRPSQHYICPIKLEQGKTYTLSAKLLGEQINKSVGIVKDGDRTSNFVEDKYCVLVGNIQQPYTFTVDRTYTNPKLIVCAENQLQLEQIFANYGLQLEEGSTATPYEPYTENIVTFNTPLRSAGTAKDKIYLQDKKWKKQQNVDEFVLNGSEDWNLGREATTDRVIFFRVKIGKIKAETLRSGKFDFVPYSIFDTHAQYGQCSTLATDEAENIYFSAPNSTVTNLEQMKTWLSENRPLIQFGLYTPTTTDIEASDMLSYNTHTYIDTKNKAKPSFDIDIPTNLSAEVTNLQMQNHSLQAQNQVLTREVNQQGANTDYVAMMTGVEV